MKSRRFSGLLVTSGLLATTLVGSAAYAQRQVHAISHAKPTPTVPLSEGLHAPVPPDGYLQLHLADGSVVHVLTKPDAELKLLRSRQPSGSFESIIDEPASKTQRGETPDAKGRSFEIQAPGAVASTRG